MSAVVDDAESKPRSRKKFSDLFDDPGQDRIRADLTTFFGAHAETYLQTYEKMRSASGTQRTMPRAWSWPVFFGSFTWFFYRKMYAYGAMLIILPIVVAYLFGAAGGVMAILFAVWAKGMYVTSALNRIVKADGLNLSDTERTDYLQKAGGVSLTAGIFAALIYAALLALTIFAAVLGPKAGH